MENDRDSWDNHYANLLTGENLYTVHLTKEKVYRVRVDAESPSAAEEIAKRWAIYWDTIVKLETWEKPTEIKDEVWPQIKACELVEIYEHVKGTAKHA